jgi:hypothetical protein
MSKKRQRVQIDYLMDETICSDRLKGKWVNAKIHKDRRGYVKVPGEMRIYARAERIVIRGGARR